MTRNPNREKSISEEELEHSINEELRQELIAHEQRGYFLKDQEQDDYYNG